MWRRGMLGAVIASAALFTGSCGHARQSAGQGGAAIRLDHFGYRPGDAKVAVFTANPGKKVYVRDLRGRVAFQIPRSDESMADMGIDPVFSGDHVWWVDFSAFTRPGTYYLEAPAPGARSYTFDIADGVYDPVLRAGLKTFYYQRCGTPKPPAYAGRWQDPSACHLGDRAVRPAPGEPDFGTLDLSGGWHDAGDYNKVVASATTAAEAIHFLLRALEDNPAAFSDDLGIPESGNGVEDVLDEIRWELDWLLKMQVPAGGVLSSVRTAVFTTSAPPGRDSATRYYYRPAADSTAVLAGIAAEASAAFRSRGQEVYAARLLKASAAAWKWLERQQEATPMVAWAAAELFRADPSIAEAGRFVERFHGPGWAGATLEPDQWDTQAAFTYCRSRAADPAVLASMREALALHVNAIFAENDRYRNGIPYTEYFWGSNRVRAKRALSLAMAARLAITGAYPPGDVEDHALDFLHYFHGQNPVRMVFLTNMASLGGEHSAFRLYHAWFGDSRDPLSRSAFLGKPRGVEEPDYPYFAGTDNHGARDGGTSQYGPPPGFLVGGPNKNYSGTSVPPANESYLGRYYRDWSELDPEASSRSWEITENSVAAQGPYVALAAYFSGRRSGAPEKHTLVYPPLKARTPAEAFPLHHAERADENGTWSSPQATLRTVHRQPGVPDAAITDGKAALAVCGSAQRQWKDELVRLTGFRPRKWTAATRLSMDLYVDRPVIGGNVHHILLYGDSEAAKKYAVPLASRPVPLLKGANSISFPLEFSNGIGREDELSAIALSIFTDVPGSGCVYLDALRLEQDKTEPGDRKGKP